MERFETDAIKTLKNSKLIVLGDLVQGNDPDDLEKVIYGIYLYKNGDHIYIYSGYRIIEVYNVELVYRADYNRSNREKNKNNIQENDIININGKQYKLELIGGRK